VYGDLKSAAKKAKTSRQASRHDQKALRLAMEIIEEGIAAWLSCS
jgi:hypothetical protein